MRTIARFATFSLTGIAAVLGAPAYAADRASGTIVCDSTTLEIKHGWLVRGPNSTYGSMKGLDDLSNPKTMLRVYLASEDVGEALKACKNLSCTKDALGDGFYIDIGDPADTPELWYRAWSADGMSRCSNSLDRPALELTIDKPDHLAGKFRFEQMGGTQTADVEFDLELANTVKTEYQFE